MSGGSSDKTEQPTQKRLADAREQGQVAKSNDLNGAVVLATATMIMGFFGPYTYNTLVSTTESLYTKALLHPHIGRPEVNVLMISMLQTCFLLVAPFFVGVAVMATLSNIIQVKPLFTVKAIQPKFEKINPLQGFKRIFSMRAVIEAAKAVLKMTIIAMAAYWLLNGHMSELMAMGKYDDLSRSVSILMTVLQEITVWSVVIFLVLGVADFFYQRYEFEKQMRMSKQEIKEERRNSDGDPMIKHRIRQMGIQMTRKRQLTSVPTADVVITNPTHFSIVIKYDPDVSPAPKVVAKGVDHFAMKIREVAKEHNVPIVENKPLARALYKLVEVDSMIPPELFVGVAQVLAFVFNKQKGRRAKTKRV
ncbi:MAG: flagellar biosynthesis protein FlhB [Cyanobacteria bacterium]|nr:flagellar biosynthesis protein FlhB [Cyanobacteriota bacterium]